MSVSYYMEPGAYGAGKITDAEVETVGALALKVSEEGYRELIWRGYPVDLADLAPGDTIDLKGVRKVLEASLHHFEPPDPRAIVTGLLGAIGGLQAQDALPAESRLALRQATENAWAYLEDRPAFYFPEEAATEENGAV